ncbi:MAG TPA: ABC transporter ATP-binding protein [Stenotrophomonas sp.]|nr:ABC transporter ATP-binding protein [Stenotrophomonas sp.]
MSILKESLGTLRLAWRADRSALALLVATRIADAVSTVGIALVAKGLIDAILAAAGGRAELREVYLWVGAELALVIAQGVAMRVDGYAQIVVRARLGLHVNMLMLGKAAGVSYARSEDPAFQNLASHIRGEVSLRAADLVFHLATLLRCVILFAGFALVFLRIEPVALAVLAIACALPIVAEVRYRRDSFELRRARLLRTRKVSYLEGALMTEPTAKEVKHFGLAAWLMEKYRGIYHGFFLEESRVERRHRLVLSASDVAASLVVYAFYAWVAYQGATGRISLGSVVLLMVVIKQGQAVVRQAQAAVGGAYEMKLHMARFFEFMRIPEDDPDAGFPEGIEDAALARVEFENVSFAYPGSERLVLKNVSFVLEPGETVAIVGRSGAGKTTLMKLMVGLYAPTAGRILVDGVDVRSLAAGELRRKIGVVFQDFSRFHFSAGDNIGAGWLPLRTDTDRLDQSVRSAGAEEVIERLPHGLDTPLGRSFGGDDLSGGQWQRIALARAFMRKAPILVLDEPTASLDAETEHEIFQRFHQLAGSRTSILITHRFSSIRMADRIMVFEDGEMVECGSHAELMRESGRYKGFFELQAEGYLA